MPSIVLPEHIKVGTLTKRRLANLPYSVDDDGHWRTSDNQWTIRLEGHDYTLHQFLWVFLSKKELPARHSLRISCSEPLCVHPEHRRLSASPGQPWTDDDWQHLRETLTERSQIVACPQNGLAALESFNLPASNCRLWTGLVVQGYGIFGYKGITRSVHRWSMLETLRCIDLPSSQLVRHLCGVELCFEPGHLALGTGKENWADSVLHGTALVGDNHPNAKLTNQQAVEIWAARDSHDEGVCEALAAKFGVSRAFMTSIWRGEVWSRVTGAQRQPSGKLRLGLNNEWDKARKFVLARVQVDDATQCWVYTGTLLPTGYAKLHFHGKAYWAHRFSYLAHHETTIAPKLHVRHGPGCQRACLNPHHLTVGTAQDNANDKIRDGTTPKGERHHSAKLTEEIVRQIKKSEGQGSRVQRAARFGCSMAMIREIDVGHTWKHVLKEDISATVSV